MKITDGDNLTAFAAIYGPKRSGLAIAYNVGVKSTAKPSLAQHTLTQNALAQNALAQYVLAQEHGFSLAERLVAVSHRSQFLTSIRLVSAAHTPKHAP